MFASYNGFKLRFLLILAKMSQSDARSTRFSSAPKLRQKTSLRTTHSYIEAHRFITPHSTRTSTQPASIDPAIISIISARTPNSNSTRIHKLLKCNASKPQPLKKASCKTQAEIFERAYFQQRQRIMTQVQGEQTRKRLLRQKLGLTRKPNTSFYKFDSLRYMQAKLGVGTEGKQRVKLHPVCRLYQQYSQRVSMQRECLENPFSGPN